MPQRRRGRFYLGSYLYMVSMNFIRLFVFVFVLFSCPGFSSAGNEPTGMVVPDLLADDFLDDENFDSFDGEDALTIYDPLEPMNRFFFEFNDVLYEWAIKPVTDGYIWLLPWELRMSFGNFFYNLAMPIRLLNSLLQADFKGAGIVLSRFTINSTLGIYGLADVAAAEFDIQPRRRDFGQTLGKWGMGQGIYLCWPLFGPSNVRDSFGLVVDAYSHPVPYFHESRTLDLAYYVSNRVNTLSLNPDLYEDLKRYSLDPYIASRHAFYEYRKAIVEQE